MQARLWIVLALMLVGCSSGGGGGGGSQAPQQCEALLSVTCDRALECLPGSYPSKDACLADAHTGISCPSAISVSSNYQPCMTQLGGDPCATLFPSGTLSLPAICSKVILTQ